MNYAAHLSHFAPYFTHKASPKSNTAAKRPGVLRRIFDAIVESRQKHVDREIALGLARSGALGLESGKWQVMAFFCRPGMSAHLVDIGSKAEVTRTLSKGRE